MFTDDEAIPTRVETLLDLLRKQPKGQLNGSHVIELLQPEGLPGLNEKRSQAKVVIRAAEELELIEKKDETLRIVFPEDDSRTSRAILCEALDTHVLGKLEVEPYFAPFYSLLLRLGTEAEKYDSRDKQVQAFWEAYPKSTGPNRFNDTKLSGLNRWFSYVGLGWKDMRETFQCNPYARLCRALPKIFEDATQLSATDFFTQLGSVCPELDGGEIFRAVTAGSVAERRCTLGLSRALIELHLDGIISLRCPTDSDGWSIADADPQMVKDLQSDKIDQVSWLKPTQRPSRRKS